MTGASLCMALSPSHDRAEWARSPKAVTLTRTLPWHPASITAPEGSPKMAISPCNHSGECSANFLSPFSVAAISSASYMMIVMSRVRSGDSANWAKAWRKTASPDFMSTVPQPKSVSRPSLSAPRVEGTLSAIGTVSRWPANTTRDGKPRLVLAITMLLKRSTVMPFASSEDAATARSAASTASAIFFSFLETLSMSTSALVRSIGCWVRSITPPD